jgi:hypothetical protein
MRHQQVGESPRGSRGRVSDILTDSGLVHFVEQSDVGVQGPLPASMASTPSADPTNTLGIGGSDRVRVGEEALP